jgi:hypothetical protein
MLRLFRQIFTVVKEKPAYTGVSASVKLHGASISVQGLKSGLKRKLIEGFEYGELKNLFRTSLASLGAEKAILLFLSIFCTDISCALSESQRGDLLAGALRSVIIVWL